MISELSKQRCTGAIAFRIRGSHVCGDEAQDVTKGHFVVNHLLIEFRGIEGGQVLVSPRVAGDLMALIVHTL